jgi:hypothetical protein
VWRSQRRRGSSDRSPAVDLARRRCRCTRSRSKMGNTCCRGSSRKSRSWSFPNHRFHSSSPYMCHFYSQTGTFAVRDSWCRFRKPFPLRNSCLRYSRDRQRSCSSLAVPTLGYLHTASRSEQESDRAVKQGREEAGSPLDLVWVVWERDQCCKPRVLTLQETAGRGFSLISPIQVVGPG